MAKRRNSLGYLEIVEESYVCCEGFDFLWDRKDIYRFREFWEQGLSVFEMAEVFNRKPEEVLFLIIDQSSINAIGDRSRGIWGKEQR